MMKKLFNRKGFSLAELLIVVAIIVVLMGVGFVSIITHMRNLHQVEMDGQAKEIFVAAQNHLAMAESQGYLGLVEPESITGDNPFGTPETKVVDENTVKTGVYYFVLGSNKSALNDTVLSQMLPAASVNEEARAGGSYIIRYQKDPAVVLDVFYVDPSSDRYGHTFSESEYAEVMALVDTETVDNKNRRKNYDFLAADGDKGVVLGYYGGVAALELKKGDPLEAPTIEIINGDVLQVKVTNNNADKNVDGSWNALNLIITGSLSNAQKSVKIYDSSTGFTGGSGRISTLTGSTVTVTLDDLTTSSFHFDELGSDNAISFLPGEDIQIKAMAFNNSVITNIAETGTYTTNSLYASLSGGTAEISSFRHLMNLDRSVSGANVLVSAADQTSDLDWAEFMNLEDAASYTNSVSLYKNGSTSAAVSGGNLLPTGVNYTLAYDGGGHVISNVTVSGVADAGLFGTYTGDSISELELVDFDISGSGRVGALVGYADGSAITGVLVHNVDKDGTAKIASSGSAAGGLAGSLSNTSVTLSAAAVYVENTASGGAAGGLIGAVSGGSSAITNSYSGGHTEGARYKDTSTGAARVNVSASLTDGKAGGLVGDYNAAAKISYSYSTCSVRAKTQGGLAGSVNSGATIEYCYAVGKVFGAEGDKVSPFVGVGLTNSSLTGQNYYLSNVSDNADDYSGFTFTAAQLDGVSAGDTSKTQFVVTTQKPAEVYDKTLLVDYGGKYYFPTVEQLHAITGAAAWSAAANKTDFNKKFTEKHYGDWQIPGLTPLVYTLVNSDTLYTEITTENSTKLITLALYGETSHNARVFVLTVTQNSSHQVTDVNMQKEGYFTVGGASSDANNPIPDGSITWFASPGVSLPVEITGTGDDLNKIVKITLDDITKYNGHFVQLFAGSATAAANLIPGENVTLLVGGGEGSWSELRALNNNDFKSSEPTKAAKTDNSLFAKNTDTADMSAANIKLLRHLQNLDTSVSGVNDFESAAAGAGKIVTTAALQEDINWNSSLAAKYPKIFMRDAASDSDNAKYVSGGFHGIYNKLLTSFDGGYSSGKYIRDLPIKAGKATDGQNNAGLFRLVSNNLTVSNLRMLRPSASAPSAGGDAGAVIARISGGTVNLSNVYVDAGTTAGNSLSIVANGSGSAGGVVGYSAATSLTLSNVTFDTGTVAATALVSSGSGNAGGLIGSATGRVTMTNVSVRAGTGSAAGTVSVTSNSGNAGGLIGSAAGTVSLSSGNVDTGSGAGTIQITSTSGSAGGVAGSIGGTSFTMDDVTASAVPGTTPAAGSFSVTSGSGSGSAGGLVGLVSGGSVTLTNTRLESTKVKADKTQVTAPVSVTANGSGAAGGLVGGISGGSVELNTVQAEGANLVVVSASGNAGGMVGTAGSTLTVINSMTNAYVTASGSGAAGGMVGQVSGGTTSLTTSYVGGHTSAGVYYVGTNANTTANGGGARWNIISGSGAAGGLIGEVSSGGKLAAEKTFTTASVYSGGAAKAGGIVGVMSGSLVEGAKKLDLVYTVAPVYNVKSTGGSGQNGGAIGTTASLTIDGDVYYLPKVYKTPKPEGNGSNISSVGSGSAGPVKVASYFESKISGMYATGNTTLEQKTTSFDANLVTTVTVNGQPQTSPQEYPFAIWTTVDGELHFYGDWEPVDEKKSQRFDVHFLMADPDTGALTTIQSYFSNSNIPVSSTVYVQMSPFEQDKSQVTLPTLPYKFGYNYGNRMPAEGSSEALAVASSELLPGTSTAIYAWSVYLNYNSTATRESDLGAVKGYYTSIGGSVKLTEQLLTDLKNANPSATEETPLDITLVAHYVKIPGQYAIQFKDYDPAAASAEYTGCGTVAVVQKTSGQEHLYYKNVYGSTANPANGTLIVPMRSVKGYRFMGWYTQPGGPDGGGTQVFANTNGAMTLMLTGENAACEITGNVVLYAWYEADQMATMTLSFVLQKDGTNYPLNITYPVRYNKAEGITAEIELPGFENGVKVKAVTDGTSALNSGYYSIVDAAGSTEANPRHQSIKFHTGKLTTYPAECKVYFEGNVKMVGVAVVHELDHTNAGYAYAESTYYAQYDTDLILDGDRPSVKDAYHPSLPMGYLTGFDAPKSGEIFTYAYSEANAAKYGVTSGTATTGEEIKWIVVVRYARTQRELRFVNLGQSQSEAKFQWKNLYVGEPLADYLPATSDYSPRYYGESYKFDSWGYEKVDGTPVSSSITTMPDYDLVLRATYKGNPVDFTVLIWVENPDDDGYTQMGSQVIEKGAYPDEIIYVNEAANGTVVVSTQKMPEGQSIDLAAAVDKTVNGKKVELSPYIWYHHSDEDVRANGRGTTKINVYFKRKVYRLRFDVGYGVPDPNSTTITYDPIGEGENYSGTVYGLVNGSYVLLTGDGTNWFTAGAENNPNSKPYALVDGQYVQLTPDSEDKYYYRPLYTYTALQNTNHNGTQYGLKGEELVELDRNTTSTLSYLQTTYTWNATTSNTNNFYYYRDESTKVYTHIELYRGSWYKVNYTVTTSTGNNTYYGLVDVGNGYKAYIQLTRSGSNNNRYFTLTNGEVYTGTRYTRSDTSTRVSAPSTYYNAPQTGSVSVPYTETDRFNRSNGSTFVPAENGAYGKVGDLYVPLTGSTTYTYTYHNTTEEYPGTRYSRSNYGEGLNKYEEGHANLIEHADPLTGESRLCYYVGTDASYGCAGIYIPVGDRFKETREFYKYEGNGQEYLPTWLNPYTGTLYKENRTQGYSSYYIGNSTNSDNYRNFTANDNYNCRKRFTDEGKRITGLSAGESPFILTTEKIYSPGYYHGTYRYGNYDIFYWDVVAKYGANIYDMWPNELTEQRCRDGNTDRTYRFIGFLANLYSNFCTTKGSSSSIKGKVDCMTDLVIKTRYTNNGSYTAQAVTVNQDGSYGDEVAHELFCRYSSGYNNTSYQTYLYRYEIKDPNKDSSVNDGYTVKYETVVRSEYGHPYRQNAGDLSGYVLVETRLVKPNGQAINSSNLQSNSDYTNNVQDIELQLPPGGTVRGVLMRFRYQPIEYNLNFEYAGDLTGRITGLGNNGVLGGIPYGKYVSNVTITGNNHIYSYNNTNNTLPGLNTSEYTFTGNWYDNAACIGNPVFKSGDANYNKTFTMPASELTLYAEVYHKPVTVTLNPGTPADGETITLHGSSGSYVDSNWTWQDPLSRLLLNADGSDFNSAFTPARTAPAGAAYHWEFEGWSTSQNGTKEDEYVYAQPQTTDVTLYPIWTRVDNPKEARVNFVYKYYSESTGEYVAFTPTGVPSYVDYHDEAHTQRIMVGDPFSMVAPAIPDYTPVDPNVGPVVVSSVSIEVPILYRTSNWTYTVNYYIEIDPITVGTDSWLNGEGTFASGKITEKIDTITDSTSNQYHLFNYLEPDACPDWAKSMSFVRYEYLDNTPRTNSYISIHPDGDNTAVVNVYLKPDTDSVVIPDIVKFYSGQNFKDYTQANPVVVPGTIGSSTAKTETRFVYYKSDGSKMNAEDVLHAGSYGVRAYITLTLGSGDSAQTYVIWKSAGTASDPAPLHLYIQRRTVILYSASKSAKYSENGVVTAHTVYSAPGTATAAQIAINDIYNALGLKSYTAVSGAPLTDENVGNAGFIPDEGIVPEFSASSFRRNIGTSLNLFTYTAKPAENGKRATELSDYYFYVMFGELTVTEN